MSSITSSSTITTPTYLASAGSGAGVCWSGVDVLVQLRVISQGYPVFTGCENSPLVSIYGKANARLLSGIQALRIRPQFAMSSLPPNPVEKGKSSDYEQNNYPGNLCVSAFAVMPTMRTRLLGRLVQTAIFSRDSDRKQVAPWVSGCAITS